MGKIDKPQLKGVKWRTDNPIWGLQWVSLDSVWDKQQELRCIEACYAAITITQTWNKAESIYGIFMRSKTQSYANKQSSFEEYFAIQKLSTVGLMNSW